MMRTALNYLGVHSEHTVMIGDRMDTDIVAGVESGMETILVLSGVTGLGDMDRFPYQPSRIATSVADWTRSHGRRGRASAGMRGSEPVDREVDGG